MLIQTLIMAAIAAVLFSIGYLKGQGQHISGMKAAANMTVEVLPMTIFAFIAAGMAHVLIPHDTISKWIGSESGMRGILIGSAAGCLSPGGPYVNIPIIAALIRSGASVGATVAFFVSWLLFAVSRLPLEVGLLGWRFTMVRLISTFFFPPIAGIIANHFFSK